MLRVGQGHPGHAYQLAPGARAGDDVHVTLAHAEQTGEKADELVVGAPLDSAGRQTESQAAVGDADDLAVQGPGDDPDREAQVVASLAERRLLTT